MKSPFTSMSMETNHYFFRDRAKACFSLRRRRVVNDYKYRMVIPRLPNLYSAQYQMVYIFLYETCAQTVARQRATSPAFRCRSIGRADGPDRAIRGHFTKKPFNFSEINPRSRDPLRIFCKKHLRLFPNQPAVPQASAGRGADPPPSASPFLSPSRLPLPPASAPPVLLLMVQRGPSHAGIDLVGGSEDGA